MTTDGYGKWQGPGEEPPVFVPPATGAGPTLTELTYRLAPTPPSAAPPQKKRGLLGKLAAPFVFLGTLLLKFKAAIFLLFKLKLFATAISMLASIGVYTMIWGWPFALGFVLLLLVHECGHVLEARRQGLPVSAPVFIPFLGAGIMMREMPKDAWREARLALGGPLLGSLGAAACWALSGVFHSDLLLALAYFGFFLNLFNLLPIVPLDGGRAAAAIHPALWIVGVSALVVLAVINPNPILIIILVLAAIDLFNRWKTRHQSKELAYYAVGAKRRLIVAACYFGLAILLAIAMNQTYIHRHA